MAPDDRAAARDSRRPGTAPLDRLRRLVHAFIRSECEEAQMRAALNDAAPLYRDDARSEGGEGSGSSHRLGFS